MIELSDDQPTADLLARLDDIERRLNPVGRRSGRVIADLLTVSVLAPVAILLDWHATRPILMLGLMVAGLAVNRLIPWATEWSLRRERDRLFWLREMSGEEVDRGTP